MRGANTRRSSRQVFLDSAASLMAERGSIDISLSDVAKRAGLNSALVRYYFGNKQGLLFELVITLVEVGLNQMRGLIEMPISPVDKLKIHVKGIINLYFRYPFLNRLVHAMLEDPVQAITVAEKITVPLSNLQKAILDEGAEQGVFNRVDPILFYFLLAGACDQIFVARNTLKYAFAVEEISEDFKRKYADLVLGIILDGLRTPAALNSQVRAGLDENVG